MKSLPFGLVSMDKIGDQFTARLAKITEKPAAPVATEKKPVRKGFGKRGA